MRPAHIIALSLLSLIVWGHAIAGAVYVYL